MPGPRIPNPYATATELAEALSIAGSARRLADKIGVGRTTVTGWVREMGVSGIEQTAPRVDLVPRSEPWDGPRALLAPPASTRREQVGVIISDIHSPYHDEVALASALALIKAVDPDFVVINGDLPDFFGISSHNRTMERLDTLQDEIDLANEIRGRIRDAAPDAIIHENEGNHDSRLVTFVRQSARQLASLDVLKPSSLNAWGPLGITPHGGAGFLVQPGFVIKHGNVIRAEAGASARGEMKRAKISGISGHTHRLAGAVEDGYRRLEWYEGGCLCQLNPDYVDGGPPNWRHGLTIGSWSTVSDFFHIDSVKAGEDGRFRYGGMRYGNPNDRSALA